MMKQVFQYEKLTEGIIPELFISPWGIHGVNHANGIKDKAKAVNILKIFKDADALDRVRTNNLNVDFLRFEESKQLLDFSWKLFFSCPLG